LLLPMWLMLLWLPLLLLLLLLLLLPQKLLLPVLLLLPSVPLSQPPSVVAGACPRALLPSCLCRRRCSCGGGYRGTKEPRAPYLEGRCAAAAVSVAMLCVRRQPPRHTALRLLQLVRVIIRARPWARVANPFLARPYRTHTKRDGARIARVQACRWWGLEGYSRSSIIQWRWGALHFLERGLTKI
jgi:hypothetical protein